MVRAHVAGYLQEPRAGRGVGPEATQGGQGPEVHLLRQIVRIGPVAEAGAEAPDLRLGPADERGDGGPVAARRGQRHLRQLVHDRSLVVGNRSGPRDDHPRMECADIREALSARLDGEDGGLTPDVLDGHLAGCRACTAWSDELAALHRMVRVREAEPVPDLSADIVEAFVPSARAGRRFALGAAVSGARWALFAVALTQLVLAVPALVLGEDAGASVHVARELGSFDVALAIGLLVAAWQPARAWGLLPVAAALALVMAGTALLDLVDGRASTIGEAHHLLDVAGVALLWLVAREAGPRTTRTTVPA